MMIQISTKMYEEYTKQSKDNEKKTSDVVALKVQLKESLG